MGKDLIAELKARAEKATPGTWEKSALAAGYIVHCDGHHEIIASVVEYAPDGSIALTFDNAEANADFITAANPQNVLALIAKVERLEADNARLEKEAGLLADHASKMERNAFPEDARSNVQWREIARKAVAEKEGKDVHE